MGDVDVEIVDDRWDGRFSWAMDRPGFRALVGCPPGWVPRAPRRVQPAPSSADLDTLSPPPPASSSTRLRRHGVRAEVQKRDCVVCSKPFRAQSKKQAACSRFCGVILRRQRQDDRDLDALALLKAANN